MTELDANEREQLFRQCRQALDRIELTHHPLFLARLALLLFEQVGDAQRCQACIAQASDGLTEQPA
ncbi:MAG: hypothetical protein VW339_14730 [Quisquiliibacterium sp.]